jgi:hypothetical protein
MLKGVKITPFILLLSILQDTRYQLINLRKQLNYFICIFIITFNFNLLKYLIITTYYETCSCN